MNAQPHHSLLLWMMKHIEIRAQAVTALGAIKEARAVDKLIELFHAPLEDKTVKAACVTALGLIGGDRSRSGAS